MVDRTTAADDRETLDLFETHETLSFVDASIGAYASRVGIDYCYSFDDDLDRLAGLTRLDTCVDPFDPR